MAETPIEIVIRARNESQAVLDKAVEQMKQLEASTKKAGAAGQELTGLRGALERISPQAAQAAAALEEMTGATAGLALAAGAIVAISSAVAALGVAAVAAAKSLGDTVERLDNLAAATGASIADIQVLDELLERQGISASVARTALNRLNIAMQEGNPLLKDLGITAKDPIQALLQLSDAMATSTDAAARAKVSQELLGLTGKDLLAVLNTMRTTFPALAREMDETNQRLGTDAVEAGRRFDASWERLTGRFEGFMNRVKVAAAEAGLALIQAFDKPRGPDEAIERQAANIESQIKRLNERIANLREKVANPSQADQIASGSPARLALGGLPDAFVSERSGQIDDLSKKVAGLQQKLSLLRRTGREFGQDDLPLNMADPLDASAAAADRLAAALDVVGSGHDKASDAVKKHAARVQELIDLFGLEKDAAVAAIAAVESRERDARKESLRISVFGGVSGANQPAPFPLPSPVPIPKIEAIPQAPTSSEAIQEVLADWRGFVDEVTSTASVLDDALGGLAAGIESGLGRVFQGMLSQGQTFGSAMVTLFRSIVDQIIAQLARLAALKFLSFLLPGLAPIKALSAAAALPFESPELRPIAKSAGGIIQGPGSDTTDNIPALLSPGEYVVRAAAVRRPGVLAQLESINSGAGRAVSLARSATERATAAPAVMRPAAFERLERVGGHAGPVSAGSVAVPSGAASPEASVFVRLATAAAPAPAQQPAPAAQGQAQRQESGNVFNIYGYDNHTILQQLLSPSGTLRRAQESLAIQGAY